MFAQRFDGQTAVVTGGASGLGRAIAARLSQEGARVVIFDNDEPALATAVAGLAGAGAVQPCPMDVADEASVRAAIDAVLAEHGQLDVLVHCAAVVGPTGVRIDGVSTEAFDEAIRVNLRGSFLMAKYALAAMAPRNYGRILLVASIAGKEGNPNMVPYSTSKAGVIGLVKALGKEYAETGITVNGLAPAVIRTPMVDATAPSQVEYMTSRIPMKRCGTLDEVAAISTWIVSKEASFNTGFVFDLSGGRATY